MPGFRNFRERAAVEDQGRSRTFSWRKVPTQATGAGIWFDLSMSPGNPVPNYYAASPGIAKRLSLDDGGLYHGGDVGPSQKKFLASLTALTLTTAATPLPMILCDYLLYYPFLDMSVTEFQPVDNTVGLSRYTSGEGVQILPVVVAGQVGGGTFNVTYTNSEGVPGRVTPNFLCNSQALNGTIIGSQNNGNGASGPFLPLQRGDKGVRLIEGITFNSADVGLVALVLVKPLATHTIRGIDAPVERHWPVDFSSQPEIMDQAYLNFLVLPNGSLSGANLMGLITTIWG